MDVSERERLLEQIKILKEKIKELEASIINDEPKDEIVEEKDKLEDELREKLNKAIDDFNKQSEKFKNKIEQVKASLVLEMDVQNMNVTEAIEGLTAELRELEDEANALASEIENFKLEVNSEGLNLTVKDIKDRVKEFKNRLRDLKRKQIEKYNLRVELTNKLISEYKEKVPVNTEAYDMVISMELLPLCEETVKDWQQTSYLKLIDYNKLVEINNQFKVIDEKIQSMKTLAEEMHQELDFINEKIVELDVIVSDEMDFGDLAGAQAKVDNLSDLLLAFGTKLESVMAEKKITEEEYNAMVERYQNYMVSYLTFVKTINKNTPPKETEYETLSRATNDLQTGVEDFAFRVDSLFGKVSPLTTEIFENEMALLDQKYNDIRTELEEKRMAQLIDDNQYNNILSKLGEIEKKLTETRLKLNKPKMYMLQEDMMFSFLNGKIDGFERTLEHLEKALDGMEKPIKDRKTRKEIDAIFKRLEAEIKSLEGQLEENKEEDEEKYNATKERLQNSKKKLDALNKKYRRKCPLMVRAVKSAKRFFKKYKKQLLIIAGLVAFAMMAHSVIIPAIMHGNVIIAGTSPALNGPVKAINNLLGGLIGATPGAGGMFWTLANGTRISPFIASSSLLKGLAISGIGTTALMAPVIVSVKKLTEKMNMAELKQKLVEGKDAVVNGVKKGAGAVKTGTGKIVGGVKNKVDELSEKNKNKKSGVLARKEMRSSIKKMIEDYAKSGLTIEEYCEQNKLDGVWMDLLKEYEREVQNAKENLNGRKGGR